MEIEKIKITDIKPASYNPRQISSEELKKLENSISTFGLVDPIIINLKNNKIIGGHQRYEVLINQHMLDNNFYAELNLIRMGDIGWIFTETDLTVEDEDHEKALNLALNKISGEWDFEKLGEILDELTINEFNIELTGFDEIELTEMEITTEEPVEVEEDDYTEPDDLEVTVQQGDIYILGNYRLMCGDSTKEEDVSLLMNGNKADMVFTDPPYGMFLDTDFSGMVGIGVGNKYKRVEGDADDFSPDLINTIFNNFDYCKEIFTWGADYYAELIPNRNNGSWIVWDKQNNGEGVNDEYDKMFGSNFELCYSKNKHKRAIARVLWKGFFGMQNEDTKKRVHPTQKPLKLVDWFLSKFSNEQDIIVDLYGGSGSTLITCEQLNRNCYMMELDPQYCQVIINRWEEFTGEKATKIIGSEKTK